MSNKTAEENEIAAAHPLETGRHDLYQEATRLVEARQSKAEFIDLVNWLLFKLSQGPTNVQIQEWMLANSDKLNEETWAGLCNVVGEPMHADNCRCAGCPDGSSSDKINED